MTVVIGCQNARIIRALLVRSSALVCESIFCSAKGARGQQSESPAREATESNEFAQALRESLCLFLMGEHDVSDEIRQRENDRANAQTLQQKIDWLRTMNQQS